MPAYAYTTPAAVYGVLPNLLNSTITEARLRTIIAAVSDEINDVCGRVFATEGTADSPVTRYFDAPPTPTLAVPDVQTIVAVRIFGVALDSTEWEVLPYQYIDPAPRRIHQLRRLAAGIPYPWYTYNAVGPSNPLRAVAVDGVWGQDPPPVVTQVALEATLRRWHQEVRAYADPAAGADGRPVAGPGPALTDEHRRRLAPYSGKQEVLFA